MERYKSLTYRKAQLTLKPDGSSEELYTKSLHGVVHVIPPWLKCEARQCLAEQSDFVTLATPLCRKAQSQALGT